MQLASKFAPRIDLTVLDISFSPRGKSSTQMERRKAQRGCNIQRVWKTPILLMLMMQTEWRRQTTSVRQTQRERERGARRTDGDVF